MWFSSFFNVMYSFLFDWTKIEFEILLKWALGLDFILFLKKFKFLIFLFSLNFFFFFFHFLLLHHV